MFSWFLFVSFFFCWFLCLLLVCFVFFFVFFRLCPCCEPLVVCYLGLSPVKVRRAFVCFFLFCICLFVSFFLSFLHLFVCVCVLKLDCNHVSLFKLSTWADGSHRCSKTICIILCLLMKSSKCQNNIQGAFSLVPKSSKYKKVNLG